MSGEVLSDIEVLCWQLAAQLTGAMLSAGVPAVLTLLALFDSLQADSIAAGVRRLERRAVTTVALLALAWVPWYGVADKPLNMPPAWYLLALLGAETDSAVRAALPDKTALNEKMVALASADLAGHPELRREYSQFERDCYVPARQKAASLGVLAKETSWPGARALVDTAGLYRSCGAETGGACSRGFFAATGAPAAASGRAAVSCRDWWLGDSDSAAAAGTSTAAGAAGLRQRMVGALRDDTEAIWNEPLQEGDGEAWLKSYLLRSPSAVADFVGESGAARTAEAGVEIDFPVEEGARMGGAILGGGRADGGLARQRHSGLEDWRPRCLAALSGAGDAGATANLFAGADRLAVARHSPAVGHVGRGVLALLPLLADGQALDPVHGSGRDAATAALATQSAASGQSGHFGFAL